MSPLLNLTRSATQLGLYATKSLDELSLRRYTEVVMKIHNNKINTVYQLFKKGSFK